MLCSKKYRPHCVLTLAWPRWFIQAKRNTVRFSRRPSLHGMPSRIHTDLQIKLNFLIPLIPCIRAKNFSEPIKSSLALQSIQTTCASKEMSLDEGDKGDSCGAGAGGSMIRFLLSHLVGRFGHQDQLGFSAPLCDLCVCIHCPMGTSNPDAEDALNSG
jgi:hypothetical protein